MEMLSQTRKEVVANLREQTAIKQVGQTFQQPPLSSSSSLSSPPLDSPSLCFVGSHSPFTTAHYPPSANYHLSPTTTFLLQSLMEIDDQNVKNNVLVKKERRSGRQERRSGRLEYG